MGLNLKAKLGLLAGALCSALCVGVGYSVFLFPDDSSNSKDLAASTKVNDVLEDSGAEDNTYVVYYFSSPFYANYFRQVRRSKKQTFDDYLAAFEANFSTYAKDYTDRKEIGYFDGNGEEATKGYYTKSYVGALDADFIDNAPTPLSTASDQSGLPVRFSGWTANMYAAINRGFKGQGDYSYVESSQSLGYLDSLWVNVQSESSTDASDSSKIAGIDGSEVSPQGDGTSFTGDHRIFLFPVMTTGRDYSKTGKQTGLVRLHNSTLDTTTTSGLSASYFTDERYFARKDSKTYNRNSSYFYYKNLHVTKNDIFYLDFLPCEGGEYTSDWYNFWDPSEGAGKGLTFDTAAYGEWNTATSQKTYPTSLRPLIDGTGSKSVEKRETAVSGEGLYNIYVYAHNFSGTTESEQFDFTNHQWKYGNFTLSDEFESLTFSSHSFVWFEDPNPTLNYISREEKPIVDAKGNAQVMTSICPSLESPRYLYKVYVKIEKVFDAHFVGGDTGSLDYNKGTSMIPIAGARTESKSSFYCYYRLDHVYLNDNKDYLWKEDGGYTYSSNLFGVLLEGNEGRVVDTLTDDELTKFNEYVTTNYHRKNTFSVNNPKTNDRFFNRLSVQGAVNKKYLKNSDKLPFTHGTEQLLLSSNSDGYFDVIVQVVFTYDTPTQTSTVSGEGNMYKTVKINSVKVAMSNSAPVGPTVWVYGSESNIPYRTIGEVQFVDTDIVYGEDSSKGWIARISVASSSSITLDSVVETYDDKFMKLSELLGNMTYNPSGMSTAGLLEHQTKINMIGKSIVHNYAAILG